MFTASGEQRHDIDRRIALAMSRCGELRQVFSSDALAQKLKLDVYKSAITSLLTYGCEAWRMDKKTQARLNGANARCLSRIIGKYAHAEASKSTRTYDLVQAIRRRRYIWLGHILRMKNSRLVKLAAKAQYIQGQYGDLFMDAPTHASFDELVMMAADRAAWKAHCNRQFPDFVKCPKMDKQRKPRQRIQKKKKKANSGYTDAQRAAFAHAHFIVHHGTKADATRFLAHAKNVNNTPATILAQVKEMVTTQRPAQVQTVTAQRKVRQPPATTKRTPSVTPTTTPTTRTTTNATTGTMETGAMTTKRPQSKWADTDLATATTTANTMTITGNASEDTNSAPPLQTKTTTPSPTTTMKTLLTMRAEQKVTRRYRTRSSTAHARKMTNMQSTATTMISTTKPAHEHTRKKRGAPKPSTKPKRVQVVPSQIPNAGMGLYMLEDVKAGDW